MISCTWNFRRHARRVAATASAVAMVSGLMLADDTGSAHAASISALRAEAASLVSRIQALGQRESALGEQYDAAELALQQTESKVAAARTAVAVASGRAEHARSVLQSAAISAYVNAGGSSVTAPSMANANESLLRTEFEQSLANTQTAAENQYHVASLEDATAETNLTREEGVARSNVAAIASARTQVSQAQTQLQAAYSSDQGQIATLVAQQEAAQQAAAQRAAEAAAAERAAEQRAAADATTTTTTTPGSTTTTPGSTTTSGSSGTAGSGGAPPPPATGTIQQIAVAAAESRVGDPYVWGGAGPNDFDCSGLVMWAYEQAGVQLPHYSGDQYADTVHIPMSDLEPGDLVFFSNPGEHVAMYVGNGDVVQAPYTGADVQIVPLYSEFTLASRVQ